MKAKLVLLFLVAVLSVSAQKGKPLFPGQPGLVSYTYRNFLSKDMPATLDSIKALGFKDMEFSSLFGKTPAELKALLDERGIQCSSFGVSYDDLLNKTEEVVQNAKTLGAQYVRVAGMPHKGALTLEEAKSAVADFNRIGKILKEQYGLTFIYHEHGFEFQPYEQGTLFDYIVTKTNPLYVSFELDILWAFLPGQDPEVILNKYGSRCRALHLKDLKKGVPRGNLSGGTPQDNDVVLGTGQIDLPAVLRSAKRAGIKHYYIEDESSNVLKQVPQSIAYLKSLTQ